jgi:hypothetical protein
VKQEGLGRETEKKKWWEVGHLITGEGVRNKKKNSVKPNM